ncbi:MAG: dethiobiotin synthase [Bacteroidia bacterium]|nr:dethiobiotin synthase [Bacteroidia bacterium]
MSSRRIFVTGIGTDVGKTVVSAILCEALQADYWKPVQTGNYFGSDAEKLRKLISNPRTVIHPESYSFKQYMSPHAAAETEGITIEFDKIVPPETSNTLIIEGAGGILVPLNHRQMIVDMIPAFGAEAIVVVQNYLGSINHSLMSFECLKQRNIRITGWILDGPSHQLSEDIINELSGVPQLGTIKKEAEVNKEMILRYAPLFAKI